MGRSADIDFSFAQPFEVERVLECLIANGVSFSYEGKLSYVLDEEGYFEWKRAELKDWERIIRALRARDAEVCTFGVSSIIGRTNSGGDFLFQAGRRTISFLPEINRVLLPGSKFCDFGWYLQRLVPIFEPLDLDQVQTSDWG